MRWAALVPFGLFGAGVALVALALREGQAVVGIAIVVPFVVGTSIAFLLGVAALFLGFVTLPLAFPPAEETATLAPSTPPAGEARASWGGIVLIGPVPLLFGSARNVPNWVRYVAAAVGAVVLAVFVVVVVGLVR